MIFRQRKSLSRTHDSRQHEAVHLSASQVNLPKDARLEEGTVHLAATSLAEAAQWQVPRRRRRWWRKLTGTSNGRTILSAFLFFLLCSIVLVMPSSYLVQGSGPAIDIHSKMSGKPLMTIEGAKTYPSETKLFMTTVSAWGTPEQGVPGVQAFNSLLLRNSQLIPVRAYYPKEVSAADVQQRNYELMTYSQDSAALVAFELAGYPVSMDVKVVKIDTKTPSGKVLKPGDIIRGIGLTPEAGEPNITRIKSHHELSQVLDAVQPKTSITLQIEREGKLQLVNFETMPYRPDSIGWVHPGSLLGVGITVENVKMPGAVKYIVEGIGGPSAGNMFALAIYDALTPGSIGGEKKIAGTGTVAWDGDVGPIGGIAHKMVGAAGEGATDFLAPAENCAETVGYEPRGMRVWAVHTTAESVQAVKAIAAGNTAELTSCKDLLQQLNKGKIR